jgi:hypothetical protein
MGVDADPDGRFAPPALLTTNQQLAPAQVLTSVIRRWPREATGDDARAHLGLETPRQWSDTAMARPTPVLVALYAIVPLSAAHRLGTNTLPVRPAAWSRQEAATCSDTLALVRRGLWGQDHCAMSPTEADVVNMPRSLLDRLTDALCYAASMDKVELSNQDSGQLATT